MSNGHSGRRSGHQTPSKQETLARTPEKVNPQAPCPTPPALQNSSTWNTCPQTPPQELFPWPFQNKPPPRVLPTSLHRDPRNGPTEPTFVIFQPYSELGQDVIAQGVAELQDLRDWGQREKFSLISAGGRSTEQPPGPGPSPQGTPVVCCQDAQTDGPKQEKSWPREPSGWVHGNRFYCTEGRLRNCLHPRPWHGPASRKRQPGPTVRVPGTQGHTCSGPVPRSPRSPGRAPCCSRHTWPRNPMAPSAYLSWREGHGRPGTDGGREDGVTPQLSGAPASPFFSRAIFRTPSLNSDST